MVAFWLRRSQGGRSLIDFHGKTDSSLLACSRAEQPGIDRHGLGGEHAAAL